MSDQFSIDTYHEILKRLPVRSLGRCCCVSKTWKSHIQSRQFIAAHLATPSAGGDGPILWATTAEYSCRRLSKPSVLLEQEEKGEREREERDRERGSGSDSSESESELEIERHPRGMLQLEGSLKQKYVLLESESESETYYRSSMEFQFPFNFPNYLRRPVEILGCVNGVLLLTVVTEYEGHLYHTMLWNPMVCRWLFLPQPQIRPKRHLCLSGLESLGFGYDPSEDDFRVVRLLYVRPSRWTPGDADSWKHTDFCTYDGDGDGDYQLEWDERGTRCPPQVVHDWADWRGWPVYPGYDYRYPPKVEVCYVKERIWRRVNYAAAADDDDQVLSSCFAGMLPKHQCYMNASVHWVARAYNKSNDNNYSTQLLVFNFESERFHSIKLPDQLAHLTPHLGQIASVAAFRGSLLISECTRKRGGISVRCSLWWLTDYSDATSWAKLVTVPLPTSLDWVLWLGSTQSDGDDDAVLVSDRRGQLMLYDPVCAMYRVLGFNPSGELGLLSIPYACPFKESLYLLDLDQDHHP